MLNGVILGWMPKGTGTTVDYVLGMLLDRVAGLVPACAASILASLPSLPHRVAQYFSER